MPDFQDRAFCRTCGYQLRGLISHRCPECGNEFDPSDPSTVHIPGYRHRRNRTITFGGEIIKAALLASVLMYFVAGQEYFDLLGLYAITLWIGIGITWVLRSLESERQRERGLPEGPRWRPVVLVLFVLALMLTIRYDSCPHAKYLKIGPLETVLKGQACGNRRHYRHVVLLLWDCVAS